MVQYSLRCLFCGDYCYAKASVTGCSFIILVFVHTSPMILGVSLLVVVWTASFRLVPPPVCGIRLSSIRGMYALKLSNFSTKLIIISILPLILDIYALPPPHSDQATSLVFREKVKKQRWRQLRKGSNPRSYFIGDHQREIGLRKISKFFTWKKKRVSGNTAIKY